MTDLTYCHFHNLWSGSLTPGIASRFAKLGSFYPLLTEAPYAAIKILHLSTQMLGVVELNQQWFNKYVSQFLLYST